MVLTILLDSSSLGVIYHLATGNSAEGGGLSRPCETLLDYASQAWTPYTKNLTDEIEKVQRPAVRFVMSDCRNCEPGSVTSDFVPKVNMAAASESRKRARKYIAKPRWIVCRTTDAFMTNRVGITKFRRKSATPGKKISESFKRPVDVTQKHLQQHSSAAIEPQLLK